MAGVVQYNGSKSFCTVPLPVEAQFRWILVRFYEQSERIPQTDNCQFDLLAFYLKHCMGPKGISDVK